MTEQTPPSQKESNSLEIEKTLSEKEIQSLVSKNFIFSLFANVFRLTVRLFVPPIVLWMGVSLEEFGLWAVCFVIIGYLGLGAFGISLVYIRYVAKFHAEKNIQKISELISTGTIVVFTISVLMLIALWWVLPYLIENFFKVDPALRDKAFILFFCTAFVFMIELSSSAFMYVLHGIQRISETTSILVKATLIETLLTFIFLLFGLGIYSLMIALIIRYFISIILHVRLTFKLLPDLSFGLHNFRTEYLELFYKFGAIVQFTGLLSITLSSIDKLITFATLGAKEVALIDLGGRFPQAAAGLPASMNQIVMPAVSHMHSQQRENEICNIYAHTTRYMNIMLGILMGFFVCFAAPLTTVWLGNSTDYKSVVSIMILAAIAQQFHFLTGQGSSYFQGIGKPHFTLMYSATRITLVSIATILLFQFIPNPDVIMIVTMVTVVTVLGSFNYLIFINRQIGLSQLFFVRRVVIPGITPYIIGYFFISLLQPWAHFAHLSRLHAFIYLCIGSTLYFAMTLFTVYFILLDSAECSQLRRYMLKALLRITQLLSKIFNKFGKQA